MVISHALINGANLRDRHSPFEVNVIKDKDE